MGLKKRLDKSERAIQKALTAEEKLQHKINLLEANVGALQAENDRLSRKIEAISGYTEEATASLHKLFQNLENVV